MKHSTAPPTGFRRSKKLIAPRIQLRFGLVFLAMAGLAAMVQSIGARGIVFKFLRKAQENKRLLTFIQSHTDSTPSTLSKAVEPTIAGQP